MLNIFKHLRTNTPRQQVAMASKVTTDSMVFRQATKADKQNVLALRPDLPTDYIPEYFDFLIEDKNRECFLIEMGKTVVSFGIIIYTDAGQTAFETSGRVHKDFEGRGIFNFLNYNACKTGKEKGCTNYVKIVDKQSSERILPEKRVHIKHIHKATVDANTKTRLSSDKFDRQNVRETSVSTIESYIQSKPVKQYLFPNMTIRVDRISFKAISENFTLLPGRSTKFYSSLKEEDGKCSGLVSAGTYYKCILSPGYYMYIADIFGGDIADLENHLMFHLNKASDSVPGPFFLEVSVDVGKLSDKVAVIFDKIQLSTTLDEDVTIKTRL